MKQAASMPSTKSATTVPLSTDTGGRNSNDLRAGCTTSPVCAACSTAQPAAQSVSFGATRTCKVTASPLCSTVTSAGASASAAATVASTAARHLDASGCSTTSVPAVHSSP